MLNRSRIYYYTLLFIVLLLILYSLSIDKELNKLIYPLIGSLALTMAFYYYNEKKTLKKELLSEIAKKEKYRDNAMSRTRFLGSVIHELKTPASLIVSSLSGVKDDTGGNHYKVLNDNSQRLFGMINDLADLNSLTSGRIRIRVEAIEVNRLIANIASHYANLAEQKNIEFEVNKDPLIYEAFLDKQVIKKIIKNILNIVFKYTSEGNSISISARKDVRGLTSSYIYAHHINGDTPPGDCFCIVISSRGGGIPHRALPCIYDRYSQDKISAGSIREVDTDTDMALAIVKKLVALHKGSLSMYSEGDKGADVIVYLPLSATCYQEDELLIDNTMLMALTETTAVLEPHSVESKDVNLNYSDIKADLLLRNRKRILLVEDDKDMKELITGVLSSEFEVVHAEDVATGAEIIYSMEINLILCDISAYKKDSILFKEEVKRNVQTQHIPLIIITDKMSMQSIGDDIKVGIDHYFEKPLDLSLLLTAIRNMFKYQENLRNYYIKNYFVGSKELLTNEQDNAFLDKLIEVIDKNLDQGDLNVNFIASHLSMSRTKLYERTKALTGKSIIEFVTDYKLKKAALLLSGRKYSIQEVMTMIGIESQSYFTHIFKKEYGQTPAAFLKDKTRTS